MPVCRECKEEVDELVTVKVAGRSKKLCEDCKERVEAQDEIGEETRSAMRDMMGWKGSKR
jgi:hypothetical protein